MSNYFIELGEDSTTSVCKCCNEKSCTGHGFVYKNNDAFAVYYVAWSKAHYPKKVTFALAIGLWDEQSTSKDRTCIGFEAYESESDILFRVIEPDESPWPKTDLMGEMLEKSEAMGSSLLQEAFVIAEEVVRNHPSVNAYLNVS